MNTEGAGATLDLRPGPGGNCSAKRLPDADLRKAFAAGCVLRERYVIVERLATGGRGTVFKALDRFRASLPAAEQFVALKILHRDGSSPEQALKDLARELHCGASLSHRNIVRTFELDRDGDAVFFTMELLEGDLLGDLIERHKPNPLPPAQAWSIIRQLGDGLQHAHERGVVHGDLKPRNLFLMRSGELRIFDFGASQPVAKAPPAPGSPKRPATYGTPAYASCEQLEGRAAEPSDDLYAYAVICYQLLAGVHPFAGRPAVHARNYGVRANRPLGLSGDQWRVLQAGLSWHRSRRSMPVRAWVTRFTRDVPADGSPPPVDDFAAAESGTPRRSNERLAAAAAMLLIAVIGVSQLSRRSAPTPDDAATATAATPSAGTVEVGHRTPTGAMAAGVPAAGVPAAGAPAAAAGDTAAPRNTAAPVPVAAVDAAAAQTGQPGRPLQARPPAALSPARFVVEGYQVSRGERFVEVRVRRNQVGSNASFVWWTEAATARGDVDYIDQAKAVQTFAAGRRSTRVYVKLMEDAERSQRDYFYVAIAQPGANRAAGKVTRAQIWLPTPRAQLQASR